MKKITLNGIAMLLQIATRHGFKPQQILAGSHISTAMLNDPYAAISFEQEQQVVRNYWRLSEDPLLGLKIGRQYPLSVLGVLGSAVPSAATVCDAVNFFIRYINLSYTYFNVSLVTRQNAVEICLEDKVDLGELRRFYIDRDITFTVKALHDILPNVPYREWLQLRFGYETPQQAGDYPGYFDCPLSFAQGASVIRVDQRLMRQPLPLSNELTFKLMEQQCQLMDSRLAGETSWRERVTADLLRDLEQPASLEQLSQQYNMTSRTLRRHLKQEACSYQQLLNLLRQQQARQLLRETHWPVERIALALGYGEAAAFIRAFKKRQGVTPTEFRRSGE